jgi:hypothetical protein
MTSMWKVAWNNAARMEQRIRKAFDAINQLGEVMTVSMSAEYRELKLAELRLEHELAERKREIAEEQRRIREQMRDEEKALRDAERAQAEAEAEEDRFQKPLDKAKVELSRARGEEHARMNSKILELQNQLRRCARDVGARQVARRDDPCGSRVHHLERRLFRGHRVCRPDSHRTRARRAFLMSTTRPMGLAPE